MTDGIEALTTSVLSLALDAAVLRQQAISNNIANANTAGYVRQGVSFDRQVEALASAAARGSGAGAALAHIRPRIEAAGTAAGAPVQLDMEVAAMAQNAAHYQALLKGIERHYAILSSAISDGKK